MLYTFILLVMCEHNCPIKDTVYLGKPKLLPYQRGDSDDLDSFLAKSSWNHWCRTESLVQACCTSVGLSARMPVCLGQACCLSVSVCLVCMSVCLVQASCSGIKSGTQWPWNAVSLTHDSWRGDEES